VRVWRPLAKKSKLSRKPRPRTKHHCIYVANSRTYASLSIWKQWRPSVLFTRNLMWNSLMTLKYRQGHRQSYHRKAVVWFLISNFGFCGRIVYYFRDIGRRNDNVAEMTFKCHSRSSNAVPIESSYMSCC